MAITASYSGNSNQTITFNSPMYFINIINDSTTPLKVTIRNVTISVLINETFEGEFKPFTNCIVEASGDWRATFEGADYAGVITASNIILSLRYELKDMNKTKYTDYELLNELNSVLIMINNTLCNMNSEYVTTQRDISLTDGKAKLPNDFQSIISVADGDNPLDPVSPSTKIDTGFYKIMNNYIYANADELTLTYKKIFPILLEINDYIPLPSSFSELIKKYIKILIKDGIDKADISIIKMIQDDIYGVTSSREYSSIVKDLDFTI